MEAGNVRVLRERVPPQEWVSPGSGGVWKGRYTGQVTLNMRHKINYGY